ncbi:hypothetical protein YC2023_098643 [Brassica napus]
MGAPWDGGPIQMFHFTPHKPGSECAGAGSSQGRGSHGKGFQGEGQQVDP